MEHLNLALILFKFYTNYLEVYNLNKKCSKKTDKSNARKSKLETANADADPLSFEADQVSTNHVQRSIPKEIQVQPPKLKGIKRKYLSEPTGNIGARKSIKINTTTTQDEESKAPSTSVLETGEGVSQDELVKRQVIIKKQVKPQKRATRRWWVREEYTDRDVSGYFASTYIKLKTSNPSEFFELTRMELPIYEILLDLLRDDLTKTSLRRPIDYECRIAVTLTHLTQSTPNFQLATIFQMGKSTIREIILETCDVIWKNLSEEYVNNLDSNDYQDIANEFYQEFGLPNCVGVFDSRVVDIMVPTRGTKEHKKTKNMLFDFTCDTNYTITWADVHSYDVNNDLETFDSKVKDIPADKSLPDTNMVFPHYFIGDSRFPLKEHIMRPYPTSQYDDPKKDVFNRYMTKARNLIENTFGALAARWTILQTEFKCYPENSKRIILAVVALHNFIMKNSNRIDGLKQKYFPHGFVDWTDEFGNKHLGEWRKDVKEKYLYGNQAKFGSNNATRNAILLRDALASYLYSNEVQDDETIN